MIKVMMENIRSKIKAFKEQKPQRYPCEHLFWGNCVKKVSENGLSYTYKHNECFLVDDINNPDGLGGIRYGEFIVLNMWQIQKLKPRVSILEQTIIDYEVRISNLEREIQNLKIQ